MTTTMRFTKIASVLLCLVMAFAMTVPMMTYAADTLTAPTIGLSVNLKDGIELGWDEIKDADGYYIYRSENGGSFKKIATVSSGDETFYLDSNVTNTNKYAYKLKAYADKLTSAYSAKKTTYRIEATTVTVKNQTKGIKVTWDKVEGAAGYKVYRKGVEGDYKLLSTKVGADNTSFVNTAVETGTIYTYLVKPYITPVTANYYNHEDNSVTIARLPKIQDVSASLIANKKIKITWTPTPEVDGYVISQKNNTTGVANNIVVNGGEISSRTIRPSAYGEFSYTVRSFVGNYSSEFSSKAYVSSIPNVASFEVFSENNNEVFTDTYLALYIDIDGAYNDSGLRGKITYETGEEEIVYLDSISPEKAPATSGTFEAVGMYTDPFGHECQANITLTAVYPEPILDTYQAGFAAGHAGNINGISLKKIVVTDIPMPEEGVARSWQIGPRNARQAVKAWRMTGEEDTLYISSCREGVKVIFPDGGDFFVNNIEEFDGRMLDTSRCTTMPRLSAYSGAFQATLKRIDYSGCDFSHVTRLDNLFNNYMNLEYANFSNCDFSNVESMNGMFCATKKLQTVDFTGAIFSDKLKDMDSMFASSGVETVDLAINTSGVTDASSMFWHAASIKNIDLSGCDFSSLENVVYMFTDCAALETLKFSDIGLPSLSGSLNQMFYGCTSLQHADLSGMNFSNVTDLHYTFKNCCKLNTELNIDATNINPDDSFYAFVDAATADSSLLTINCTQEDKDKLFAQGTLFNYAGGTTQQNIVFNITQ